MNSKIYIFIIALIALAFLSMPVKALGVNGDSYTFNCNGCPSQGNNEGTQPNMFIDNLSSNDNTNSKWSWIDLGASYGQITLTFFVSANIVNPTVINFYPTSAFNELTITGNNQPAVNFQTLLATKTITTTGTYSVTFDGSSRYIAITSPWSGVQTSVSISTKEGANPESFLVLPNITSWSNSFTNDASLTLSPPTTTTVIFSVTGTSQNITTYTWSLDGINQNNNFSSLSTQFTQNSHTLSVTATNANGTSSPVAWTINPGASAPCAKPDNGANVCFDKSSYIVGDNINISWFLSDDTQADFFNKKLRLSLNDVPVNTGSLDCGGCVSITSQQGFYVAQATTPGIFKADVIEGIISYSQIGTATVVINPPSTSYLVIANTTMYARNQNNVSYHIGYSVSNYPAAAIEIDFNELSSGNLVDSVFPTVFPDGTMVFGQVHPIPVGNYSARLIDSVKNQVLDTKYFTAIPSPIGIPTLGITTPSISTDKTLYFYNDYMYVNYEVDDTNFSNFNYTIMAHVKALDHGGTVTKMVINPFVDQVGTFTSIVNINKNMKCDKGLNCWFETGNNSINLVLMNTTTGSSGAITIAFANFTVSSTTVDGYGLTVSTTTPNTNEIFTATTTVPAGHLGFLSVANAGTKKTIFVYNQTVGNLTTTSPSIQTFPITIQPINTNPVAYYVVDLVGDDNLTKVSIPITVNQKGTPTWTGTWTPPQGNIGTTCSFWDGIVGLFFASQGINDTTRLEFSLMVVVIVLITGMIVSKANFGVSVAIAFLPYAFFLALTLGSPCGQYMPAWTAVFIALILIVKSRWL